MASKGIKINKFPKTKKAYLFILISFFAVVSFFVGNVALAYYHNTESLNILSNLIGDFDTGNGDINIMLYKELEKDSNVFTKTAVAPALGYEFDSSLTSCTKPCDDDQSKNCSVTCGTDSSSSCYYTYDSTNKSFSLTSVHKVTCKFYFKQESTSDINVYIMIEDEAGTYTANSKTYSLSQNIPAYGYKYASYTCDNPVESLEYISETKKFKVSTATKNTCYAYFDYEGEADIIVNVYVQEEVGGTVYNLVQSIPENNVYNLSTVKESSCYDSSGNVIDSTIEYSDGYINVSASEKQTCDVYLDLSN